MRIRTCVITGLATLLLAASAQAAPIGAYTTKGAWNFVSAPSVHPPKLLTDARTVTNQLAPGDFLLANFPSVGRPGPMTGQGGPLIVDSRLRPVWFASVGTGQLAANLQQEVYNGSPVLVYWQGLVTSTGVTTKGQVVVLDQHYRTVAKLRAKAPWVISLHDAQITGSDILVSVYRHTSSGRRSVLDAGVQEYDLRTGRLLSTWDALEHVPLSDSYEPVPNRGAWDAYHVNSVEPLAGGQFLVSMRNTWAAYRVSLRTGRVLWRLGGRHSSVKLARTARFAWQHDVQLLPGNEITLFNDNCCAIEPNGDFGAPSGVSAGLILRLKGNSVSRVAAYSTHKRTSAFLGSMVALPGGNALVGYGSLPYLSEFSASGRLLLDAMFPGKDQSYRAGYSASWVGTPSYSPAGAARKSGTATTIYASWNGATQLASWEFWAGRNAAALKPVGARSRNGFETSFTDHDSADKVFEVVALDAAGQRLGASRWFSPR